MIDIFEEAVKSSIKWKRRCDVKTAVMGDKKVIIEVIDQISDHGKAFVFHDNERTDYSMIRKAFPAGFGIFRNK